MEYIGIEDEVRRYFDNEDIPDLHFTNAHRVVSLNVKNESCNYLLFICKKSEKGLQSDKIKVAEIVIPGKYFHRSYNAPRLVNCCYFFRYMILPESARIKDDAGNDLPPFQQVSFTIEKENC